MWRRRKPLTCRELVELVTDYLEGSLSRADRRRFEGHIDACGNCREYLAQFRETVAITGTLREQDLDAAMRDELLAHFGRWHAED